MTWQKNSNGSLGGNVGIIEERLAELEAKERVRVRHEWRACPGVGSGSGGSTCRLCGGWTMRPWLVTEATCPGGPEAWRMLRAGDTVRVVSGVSDIERAFLGQVFVIERFARPHGYAVVRAHGDELQLHPEALVKVAASIVGVPGVTP